MPEENESASNEVVKKKRPKIKLIVVAIVVLILIVAGAAGYFFIVKKDSGSKETTAKETSVKEKNTEKKADVTESKKSGPSSVYSIGAIIVNLADQEAQKYLKVQIALELSSPKLEEEIKKREPQIKDIIISVLSSKTMADVSNPQGKIALKQEIMKRINLSLVEGEVTDMFFSEFVIQ
jgi:flagellar FliL protein